MSLRYLGELAALTTSVCFTAGSVFFTLASRQVGPFVLNRMRLVVALLLLALVHWIVYRLPYPAQAGAAQWFWLGISGLVGLVLGDILLFKGYALVGPRLTMLMMSLSPILTALLAWLFMGETLNAGQMVGVAVTLAGIAWVVMDRNHAANNTASRKDYRLGLIVGLGAAAGQSVGLILARQGLGNDFPALSGNFIRMVSASLGIWILALFQGEGRRTLQSLQERPGALRFILLGALAGPFLGVSLSLYSIQHAEMGVASTLMALPPVLLLPISFLVFKERFGWQSILGTLLAMTGIAILFLV